MKEFLDSHGSDIVLAGITVLVVVLLIYLIHKLFAWGAERLPDAVHPKNNRSLISVKRILQLLVVILGVMEIIYLFADDDRTEVYDGYLKQGIYLALVGMITIILAMLTNYWFREAIHKRAIREQDQTNLRFLRYVSVVSIYFVGILLMLFAIPSFSGLVKTALGGAGILAIVIGVASQEALANLIGGFFIIWFNPFKVGDTVKIDDLQGSVVDITLRHTVIRNYNNNRIIIPNSVVNKVRLINFNIDDTRVVERIEIGISYESSVTRAKEIMKEICEAHPNCIDARSPEDHELGKPIVRTAMIRIEPSAFVVRAWAWAASYGQGFDMRCDVVEEIASRFSQEGITIAYPHVTVLTKEQQSVFSK